MANPIEFRQYSIHDAKSRFSQLIEAVENGAEIVIARDGRPVARLSPLRASSRAARRFGTMKDEIWIADDFDASLPRSVLRRFHALPPQKRKSNSKPQRRKSDM